MNRVAMAAAAVAGLAAAGLGLALAGGGAVPSLDGGDLGRIRDEALALYPVGTPVEVVERGLTAARFACGVTSQPVENVTAPVLFCRSNGRSGGTSAAVFITVVSRSAALTDFGVSDGLDPVVADARHPHPAVPGRPATE